MPRYHFVVTDGLDKPRCNARLSPRSTCFCEMPADHEDPMHTGRTRGGRWKSWPVYVDRKKLTRALAIAEAMYGDTGYRRVGDIAQLIREALKCAG